MNRQQTIAMSGKIHLSLGLCNKNIQKSSNLFALILMTKFSEMLYKLLYSSKLSQLMVVK